MVFLLPGSDPVWLRERIAGCMLNKFVNCLVLLLREIRTIYVEHMRDFHSRKVLLVYETVVFLFV